MSLAEIKKKIETEAREEGGRILDKARSLVASINEEMNGEIKKIEQGYEDRFRKEQPEMLRRREIVAGLDVKKIELGVKQDAISEALVGALSQLGSLQKDKYLNFVGTLLAEAVETGEEEVLVSESEKFVTSEWIAEYNAKTGKKLTLGKEKRPITGGFILKQGDIETNCSWDMLIRWIRDDIEADVVKRLFSA